MKEKKITSGVLNQTLEGQTLFGVGQMPAIEGEPNHGELPDRGSIALRAHSMVYCRPWATSAIALWIANLI